MITPYYSTKDHRKSVNVTILLSGPILLPYSTFCFAPTLSDINEVADRKAGFIGVCLRLFIALQDYVL